MNQKLNMFFSVVTPCYNEEDNCKKIYELVKEQFLKLGYPYEHIFIDNASTDRTVVQIKEIISYDQNVRLIVNSRNFGHLCSPYYGLLQTHSTATFLIVCDLQDPPELIPKLIQKWEEGFPIVVAVKEGSEESSWMFALRKFYYFCLGRLTSIPMISQVTAFGLYDAKIIELLRQINDPYPYLRGILSELGFEVAQVPYIQPKRYLGKTHNNFYTLYDLAILGITNYSKVPLRLMTFLGFFMSFMSVMLVLVCCVIKIFAWKVFQIHWIPLGIFLFLSIQLFFMGILGEYIGFMHTRLMRRPLVIEKERINFKVED